MVDFVVFCENSYSSPVFCVDTYDSPAFSVHKHDLAMFPLFCCSILPVSAMTEILRFFGTNTFMDEFQSRQNQLHTFGRAGSSDPEQEKHS